jgi:hypothetical protein
MWMRGLLCGFVLLAPGLVCWPTTGWADEGPERALTAPAVESVEGADDLADVLLRAIEAYDHGDLVSARRLFELVHARAPTARTLRSLGLVAFREHRYEDAVALLAASLASQVKPLTESQREGAAAVLREARAMSPAQSEPALAAPVVAAPPARVEVVAPPAPVVGPQQVERVPARTSIHSAAVPSETVRGRRFRRAGYALLGVAAAALITSITSYQVGLSRLHKIEDKCRPDPGCELAYVQKREQNAHLDALGTLSLVSGIVAGVTGASGTAFLIWRWRSDRNDAAQAELGLGWQGVF